VDAMSTMAADHAHNADDVHVTCGDLLILLLHCNANIEI